MPNSLELTSESLRTFEKFYNLRVAEAGGATQDSQELEIARDILAAVVSDGLTPTADGGASYVRRGAVDWTDPATLQAAQAAVGPTTRPQVKKGKGGRPDWLQGLGLLAVAGLALGWFFWPTGAAEPAVGIEIAPAAEAPAQAGGFRPTPSPVPTLETELLADIVGAGTKTKQLVVPRTLEVRGVSFVVQPVKVGVGDWPPPEVERAVSWVSGTVINYVMGLEGSPANQQLLAGLQPGNQLLLRMSTGVVYRFVYADTVRVAPQASEVFWQRRPSLTLVLLGNEAETRVVIRALYVPDAEVSPAGQAPVTRATAGQRVVLDDKLRLTYLGTKLVPAPASLPGYAYLGIEAVLEYAGGEGTLLAAGFMHHLEADGLVYPLVSTTSQPVLPDSLPPRQPLTTTLVYAVPDTVLRQELSWHFAADPTEGEKVQVVIPPVEGRLSPEVAVKSVELQSGTLVLTLTVTAALQPLELTPADLEVQGGQISAVGNSFPWRLPAGETGEFVLLVSPDGSGPVRVAMLDQGIEVTFGN